MPWKANRPLLEAGFSDLRYLPRERCGWDATLAALAYGIRAQLERRLPDLNAWAAQHGNAASGRYQELGPEALVLWHGTSRERADRIAEHGLFHKRGLWTTTSPHLAHGFTRGRSERFGVEGAMVCLVVDRGAIAEGRDYELEGKGDILRFHHGLPVEVVEYVLVHEEVRSTGQARARRHGVWPQARFRKQGGEWVPVQKSPVRYSDGATYTTPREFARLCVLRLLAELQELAALEVFSTLYATLQPWDALSHQDLFALVEEHCLPARQIRRTCRSLRARDRAL